EGVHRNAVREGGPLAADRAAVGDGAAADQAHAVVRFAEDAAAAGDFGTHREADERIYFLVEQRRGGDARPGARDGAAVGHARCRGADGDAGVGRCVEAVIDPVAADGARIVHGQRAVRAAVDARGRAGVHASFLVGDYEVGERAVADALGE